MLGLRRRLVCSWVAALCALALPAFAQQTPAGLKVAFTGDQSLGSDPEAVLQLVVDEGAEALFVQGDFDYEDDPAAWDDMLTRRLGADFPVIALVGNHDEARWYGAGGYQDLLAQRMQRTGLTWTGELGVQATLRYKGLFVVQTAPDVFDDGYDHAAFIRDSLAGDGSIWSISAWHKLMNAMQVGGKGDETGWEVYEESRRGGAIIATAHEHSYSRTHLMSSMQGLTVASTAEPLVLAADDPATGGDEGRSFAFVSGLGGSSIRDQERTGDWWASVYTSTQGAEDGALFATFHVNGDPRLAHFYFKDVTGKVVDDFTVRSNLGVAGPATPTPAITRTPTPTPSPTRTPTPTATPTRTPTPTATSAPTRTPTPTALPTPTATVRPTPLPTPAPTPTGTVSPSALPTAPPTTAPTPVPTAVPDPVACADGVDNDGDGRVDYPADKGCRTADDLYEQRGKSWRRLLREMARERGVSRKQLRREIRGTEQEQRLIELGMPQR
jgi:hypothetical protein